MEEQTYTGEDFVAQPLARQQEILASLSPIDRKLMRVAARKARLHSCIVKANARLKVGVSKEKAAALKVRVAEYERSLDSLAKFRQERPPSGNPVGVEIDTPIGGK